MIDRRDRARDDALPRGWRPTIRGQHRGRAIPCGPDPDLARDQVHARIWRPGPYGAPVLASPLAEAILRSRDPWRTWRTCTELDLPDPCGRRVPLHLTQQERDGEE